MIKLMATAVMCLLVTTSYVSAKSTYQIYDRHAVTESYMPSAKQRSAKQSKPRKEIKYTQKKSKPKSLKISPIIVAHPPGCPRVRFCGCGASIKVFNKRIPSLYLARNWYRFPPSTPGPGKVAVRNGHVFVILKDLGLNRVLAYDPNSGGHKTRIHVRSLAGYSVRNPKAKG